MAGAKTIRRTADSHANSLKAPESKVPTSPSTSFYKGYKMKKVWLLTTGDGSDGDEWSVKGIYASEDDAELARKEYELPRSRSDGSTYIFKSNVEEWNVEP